MVVRAALSKLTRRFDRLPRMEKPVLLATALYAMAMSTLTVARIYALHTFAWDLGAFSQALHTTLFEGKFLYYTMDLPNNPSGSYFGAHFAPFLLLLLPLYYLLPFPSTLLVVQTIAIAFGGLITFKLAYLMLRSERIAALLAVAYLLNPAIQGVNWFDFHLQSFLLPFLLLSLYYWQLRSWWKFWAAVILSLSTIEMAGVVVASMGLFMAFTVFEDRRKNPLRAWGPELRVALAVVAVGLAYLAAGVRVINLINPGNALLSGGTTDWAILGASSIFEVPLMIVVNLITSPGTLAAALAWDGQQKLLYLLLLFGPAGFLPLLRRSTLILYAPWLALSLTSNRVSFYQIGYQYPAFLAAFIFFGAILGIQRLQAWRRASDSAVPRPEADTPGVPRSARRPNWILAIGVVLLIAWLPLGPLGLGGSNILGVPTIGDHEHLVLAMAGMVPSNGSVLTQNNLFPLFADRSDRYVIPHSAFFPPGTSFNETVDAYLQRSNYVFVDMRTSETEAVLLLARLQNTSRFGVLASGDGAILLREGYSGPPNIFVPYSSVWDSRNLEARNGSPFIDPFSRSGRVLSYVSSNGSELWRALDLMLWPGDYNVTLSFRVESNVSGRVGLAVALRPGIVEVQNVGSSDKGHVVHLMTTYGNCEIPLTSVTFPAAPPGDLPTYQTVSLHFRADIAGLYPLTGAYRGRNAIFYLDQVRITQESSLAYLRTVQCPRDTSGARSFTWIHV